MPAWRSRRRRRLVPKLHVCRGDAGRGRGSVARAGALGDRLLARGRARSARRALDRYRRGSASLRQRGGAPRGSDRPTDRQGVAARAAVADAPGAAWAVARYGAGGVVPAGRSVDAVATLSVRALRIAADKLTALHRLGIERVGQLAAMPRAPLVRRFGRDVALRLDQALGHAFEPITPLIPEETPTASRAFAEPIGRLEDLKTVVLRLAKELCRQLEHRGEGVRRLDLLLQRVDRRAPACGSGPPRPIGTRRISSDSSMSASRPSIRDSASRRSCLLPARSNLWWMHRSASGVLVRRTPARQTLANSSTVSVPASA